MSRLNFQLEHTAKGSQARAGRFRTLHNEVLTPLFMPVGTIATVRAQKTETLFDSGSQILLANTYHLIQRPGLDVMESFGGIHDFMKWKRSVLTDSGGYQIFSLPKLREMKEEGAWFKSPIDGQSIHLSPEASITAQKSIGSDIMMVLDECIDSTSPKERAVAAMERTHRWAKRSFDARGDHPAALFGIVQGACFEDLRRESAETLREIPFDGMAIGGLAVGEGREERERIVGATTLHMPTHLPRYLMGVGTPIDLLEAVHRGVDMFDCILPTAFAQQGMGFTSKGRIILRRGIYRMQKGPLDENCDCPTCSVYDRGYLQHLIRSREILGWNLIGQHNLYFYHRMMREMREAIFENRFVEYYDQWKNVLAADDLENPIKRPKPQKVKKAFPRELGDYRIHESVNGEFSSIQQISSGEIMHSVTDPIEEAKRLYVDQLDVASRLERSGERGEPFVIWDVGMGAATNAMAILHAAEKHLSTASPRAQVIIESFERDLDSFKLALMHPYRFRYLQHPAPFAFAEKSYWESPDRRIIWRLRPGDFSEQFVSAEVPHVILYDPFSFKIDSPLWEKEIFERLNRVCNREGAPVQTELFTYSNSTLIRARLLAAGWYVARGVGTGPKSDTTIATNLQTGDHDWLDATWLGRWERSGARDENLDPLVFSHAQFAAFKSTVTSTQSE
ncbi:MAG: tRNA guanosine(34) transglycosylase Tgt [Cryobacterium sp.]|nr:tRNA guanosine(34) transglycosylase Tgt [Oligoflexia bacterium]